MPVRAAVPDAHDTGRKVGIVRSLAQTDPQFAVKAARAIAAHPSLLEGAGAVIAGIARHDEAAAILADVFTPEVVGRYPSTYRSFLDALYGS